MWTNSTKRCQTEDTRQAAKTHTKKVKMSPYIAPEHLTKQPNMQLLQLQLLSTMTRSPKFQYIHGRAVVLTKEKIVQIRPIMNYLNTKYLRMN